MIEFSFRVQQVPHETLLLDIPPVRAIGLLGRSRGEGEAGCDREAGVEGEIHL